MNERVAKGIIRKYGHRKDYLTADDCTKVLHRRYAANQGKGKGKRSTTPKKDRSLNSSRR